MVFQQVLSFRPGQRRAATWDLSAGRRVYISNPTAPLNAAPSLVLRSWLSAATRKRSGERRKNSQRPIRI